MRLSYAMAIMAGKSENSKTGKLCTPNYIYQIDNVKNTSSTTILPQHTKYITPHMEMYPVR